MGLDQFIVKKRSGNEEHEIIISWRKENHLQNWFINHTDYDEGTQEPSSEFGIEKIEELLSDLKNVNEKNADTIMPTRSGFFYGSTNYDEYYFSAIKNEISELEEVIANHKEGDTYQYETWY